MVIFREFSWLYCIVWVGNVIYLCDSFSVFSHLLATRDQKQFPDLHLAQVVIVILCGQHLGVLSHYYPLVVPNIAIAGISPIFHRNLHLQSGSIFQPAMLVYRRVNDSIMTSVF